MLKGTVDKFVIKRYKRHEAAREKLVKLYPEINPFAIDDIMIQALRYFITNEEAHLIQEGL